MAGRRKWSELRAKVAPEVLAEAALKKEQMVPSFTAVAGKALCGEKQPPIPGSERERWSE